MTNIPLFDSLTHPTLDGNWIMPQYPNCASFDDLQEQMITNNIVGAFAVGMKGIGNYSEDDFIVKCGLYGNLFPIAFFSFEDTDTREKIVFRLRKIKIKGYYGIKLHPRIGQFSIVDERLPVVINEANKLGLIVLLCTYFYSNKQSLRINNLENLSDMLLNVDEDSKVVLLHGGGVRLLDCMEITRAFPNVLLDISLTLCKYEGCSLDQDIAYLFKLFDRRVCVGSDHPEISLAQLRSRFDYFAVMTSYEKAVNIAYKNIKTFLNLS